MIETLPLTIVFFLILAIFVSVVVGLIYLFSKFVLKAYFEWTWRETFTIIVAIISGIAASKGTDELAGLITQGKTSFEKVREAIVDSIGVSEERIITDIRGVDKTLVKHEKMLKEIHQKMPPIDIQKNLTKRIDSLNQEMNKRFSKLHARLYYVDGHLGELTFKVLPDSLKNPIGPK